MERLFPSGILEAKEEEEEKEKSVRFDDNSFSCRNLICRIK